MPQDHVVREQPDLTDEGRWEVVIQTETGNGTVTRGLPFNFETQEEAREIADTLRPFVARHFKRQEAAVRAALAKDRKP